MAPKSEQMRICGETASIWTSPEEMVLATAVPHIAPSRFVSAASTTAWRGVKTFVETTVAMEFAVSWKPLMYSKISATRKTIRIGVMAERLSYVTKKFRYLRCARFDRWRGATKEHSRQRSVTEEQRSHRSNLTQPCGLPSFSPLPALLAPHRPLTGMLVARALAEAKNPGNACVENSLSQY